MTTRNHHHSQKQESKTIIMDKEGNPVVQESSLVIEVEHNKCPKDTATTAPYPVQISNHMTEIRQQQSSSVDEDCLTVTEVTDLSTIDEITVEEELEYDEQSCRTTATMVSSNTGTTDSPVAGVITGPQHKNTRVNSNRSNRGCSKTKPSSVTDYLRMVSTHCQVIRRRR